MKSINLTKLLKGFSSGWVAISADYKNIVASGKTLKEVTEKVQRQKTNNVVLISASKNYRGYITLVKRQHDR